MRKLMIGTSVVALCAGFAMAPHAAEVDRTTGTFQVAQAGQAPTTSEMQTEGDTKGSSPRVGTKTGSDMRDDRASGAADRTGTAGDRSDATAEGVAEEAEDPGRDVPTTAEMQDEGDTDGSARVGTATGGDTAGTARGDVQTGTQGGATQSTQTGVPADTALRTGMTAMTMDGEAVGTVQDVVRDTQGAVSGLIVRTKGGLLGIGKSNVEVPIENVQVLNDAVTIAMTEDQFAELPDHEG